MKMKDKVKLIAAVAAVLAISISLSAVFIVQIRKEFEKPVPTGTIPVATGGENGYFRHCYEELNDVEKKFYGTVIQQIYSMPKRIEVPSLDGGDLNKVFEALSFDNPDLFCLGRTSSAYIEGKKVYFEPEYSIKYDEYTAMISELNDAVNLIIEGAKGFTTVYEIELYVHDFIIQHCVYTEPTEYPFANDAYGCVVGGRASCEGYSRAFQLIMNRMGYDVRLVTGEAADDGVEYIGHMWNYIVIDGTGYYVDLTWDDPRMESETLRHAYFNVNTADILLKHRNILQNLPVCTNREYNYYIHENAYIAQGSGENFEQAVTNAVALARQRGYSCAEIRFSDANALERAKYTLFTNNVVYDVYYDAGLLGVNDTAQVYYSTDKSLLTMCLFF